jgi:hypothetical protein
MPIPRKKRIRVIKLSTVSDIAELQVAAVPAKKLLKDSMAELRCSVSKWVVEFKERHRPDPKTAFQALFKE